MKKAFFISFIAVSCIAAVIYAVISSYFNSDLHRMFISKWIADGSAYCNETYQMCVDNVPEWNVHVPTNRPPDLLLVFRVFGRLTVDKNGSVAKVSISPAESLEGKNESLKNPSNYLRNLLEEWEHKYKKRFDVTQQISSLEIKGIPAAVARFDNLTDDRVTFTNEIYVFIHEQRVYVIYYSARKSMFERHYSEAKKIIESFTVTEKVN